MTTMLHCTNMKKVMKSSARCKVQLEIMTGLEPSAAEWITTEIEVRIRESHGDDDFINQTGVIRNISVGILLLYCY